MWFHDIVFCLALCPFMGGVCGIWSGLWGLCFHGVVWFRVLYCQCISSGTCFSIVMILLQGLWTFYYKDFVTAQLHIVLVVGETHILMLICVHCWYTMHSFHCSCCRPLVFPYRREGLAGQPDTNYHVPTPPFRLGGPHNTTTVNNHSTTTLD